MKTIGIDLPKASEMSTYQFFKRTIETKSESCYLCIEQDQFLANRERLLAQGFEVDGYIIYAPNEKEAIARFNQEKVNPLIDCDTSPDTSGVYRFFQSTVKSIGSRIKKLNQS